jgi:hypothetical protein
MKNNDNSSQYSGGTQPDSVKFKASKSHYYFLRGQQQGIILFYGSRKWLTFPVIGNFKECFQCNRNFKIENWEFFRCRRYISRIFSDFLVRITLKIVEF